LATGERVFRGRDAAIRKVLAAVSRQMIREHLVIGAGAGFVVDGGCSARKLV